MESMKNSFIMLVAGIIILSVFFIFIPIETCSASGDALYVGSGQTYSTIQSAINAANPGDTIYVYSGTYIENIEITKTLTLSGYDSGTKTINGVASGNVIEITADYVNLSGFTIQNPIGADMKCIMMDKVQNCRITNNIIRNSYGGIYLLDSSSNTISGNTIKDNDANGIYVYFSSNNIFEDNNIQYNPSGIYIGLNSNNNDISYNDVLGVPPVPAPQGFGISIGSSTTGNTIYHNHFNDFNQNAKDLGTGNFWYESSIQEGNYWDDYTGIDADEDGIGDIPYTTDNGRVQDIYPLGYFEDQPPENQAPVADAGGPYSGYTNDAITFDGSGSSDSDGDIAGYRWDWTNDDTYDTSWLETSITTHSYSAAGTYTVKLQVKDDNQTDTDTTSVTVLYRSPTADVDGPYSGYINDTITFDGSGSSYSDGTIDGYRWDWTNDGFWDTEWLNSSNATHIYSTEGIYIVMIQVKSNHDTTDTDYSTVTISSLSENQAPVADAGGSYSGYTNDAITFNGSGSTDDGTIVLYEWDFGDGNTGTGVSPVHTYIESGNYTVTLMVTDDEGKNVTSSTYANITIQPTDLNGNGGIPGFEIILVIITIAFIVFWKRR